MGSRSKARARAQASAAAGGKVNGRPPAAGQPTAEPTPTADARPSTLLAAAAVEGLQVVGIVIAAVLAGIATLQGKSYQDASGIAITLIGLGAAVALGFVAYGLTKARRWSRTPALLTQLFTGIIGIYLVQGARYWWGVPALALSVAGFVLLLVPPSIRALTGRGDDPRNPPAGTAQSSPVSPSRS